jgi:hypothetical protein
VRILGHAGRILRSYLHDFYDHGIQAYIAMTKLENHTFTLSLVWLFQILKSSGCLSSISHEYLPMGVK